LTARRLDRDSRHKTVAGDLFAKWGVLSLGVELENGQRDFHPVNAAKWFEARHERPSMR